MSRNIERAWEKLCKNLIDSAVITRHSTCCVEKNISVDAVKAKISCFHAVRLRWTQMSFLPSDGQFGIYISLAFLPPNLTNMNKITYRQAAKESSWNFGFAH